MLLLVAAMLLLLSALPLIRCWAVRRSVSSTSAAVGSSQAGAKGAAIAERRRSPALRQAEAKASSTSTHTSPFY